MGVTAKKPAKHEVKMRALSGINGPLARVLMTPSRDFDPVHYGFTHGLFNKNTSFDLVNNDILSCELIHDHIKGAELRRAHLYLSEIHEFKPDLKHGLYDLIFVNMNGNITQEYTDWLSTMHKFLHRDSQIWTVCSRNTSYKSLAHKFIKKDDMMKVARMAFLISITKLQAADAIIIQNKLPRNRVDVLPYWKGTGRHLIRNILY